MKEIIFNHNNLRDSDIDEIVTRTKALIINSKNEITLGYSHKTYQFPGGHLEKGESLKDCIIREIKEETGINISSVDKDPFVKITYYNKNYRGSGKNRKNEIYYFIINTDEVYNMDNSSLDDFEKEGDFSVKRIPLNTLEKTLISSINDNPINKIIVEEMLEVFNEYKKII